jgi:hypothetical protein
MQYSAIAEKERDDLRSMVPAGAIAWLLVQGDSLFAHLSLRITLIP